MLSIKLNLLFYNITKLQLDWTLDGDGTPLYMTGILQASPPMSKLGLSQYTDRSPLELSVYRWVYLVKATLIWFMVVKVETILPMEITATCVTWNSTPGKPKQRWKKKQNKTKQNKNTNKQTTKQNKTKQKTKQNKTKQKQKQTKKKPWYFSYISLPRHRES